jgi:hypothetical protein
VGGGEGCSYIEEGARITYLCPHPLAPVYAISRKREGVAAGGEKRGMRQEEEV